MTPSSKIPCHECSGVTTYRMSSKAEHLYRCPRGHVTSITRTQAERLEVPPPRARSTDPDTSHAAAESVQDVAGVQRLRILQELEGGPLTADELDERIGWRVTTAGRRLSELLEMVAVRRLEATKKTRSGRAAHLWELDP